MKSVVLSALVLAIAVPACGKGGAEVEVVAGAPAGDVTEVAGTVTATRAGQVRPLRVGDAVSGDDVIATAADGRVTIALRHNHVPWSLGPGASRRVADSAAWRAPEGANVADVTDTVSGAAGRHAERTAADTIATAGAPARAAVVPTEGEVAEKRFASREEPVGTKLESPPPPPPDPADGPADRPGGGRPDPTGGRAPVEVETRRVLQAHQVALARCHAEAPAAAPELRGGLVVALAVTADGTVTRADVTGPEALAAVRTCLHDRLMTIRFPARDDAWTLTLPLTFASAN